MSRCGPFDSDEARLNRLLIRHGWSLAQFARLPAGERDYWKEWEYHEEQNQERRRLNLEQRINSMYVASDPERQGSGPPISGEKLTPQLLLEMLRLINEWPNVSA